MISDRYIETRLIGIMCYFVLVVVSLGSLVLGAEKVTQVEGIFYLDGAPLSVEIADGKISKLVRRDKLTDPQRAGIYIAPGLIDIQINGYVTIGFTDPGLTVDRIREATRALWKVGVTTYLPTVITSSPQRLIENFAVLARATHDPEIGLSIPGFHLEGPYISPVEGFRGAHNVRWIRAADWREFSQIYEAAEKKILQVTIAPEIEGAMDFIRNCRQLGIVVALGHHNGTSQQIKAAVDAGAATITHLGNGVANMIHRHDNPFWPQLADDRLMAGLIVDGFHLRPEEVQTFYKVKGPERVILTSDVTKLAGMPPGEYTWDEKTVVLTPEGVIRYPAQNVLAGAAAPLITGVANIMRFTQCSLADAIHMASRNPARLHGLDDRGEIRPGKRADLILFTLEHGEVIIQQTIIAGKVVYSADQR